VVVISGDSSSQTVQNALALGARAYLKKTGNLSEVIAYLHAQGLITMDGAATDLPWDPAALLNKGQGLSERQTRILQWILEGKSNREIGELAFLARGTVKNHVTTLLLHFGVKTRAQLISTLR
jgi:DNA-binding NarL/FixJ family response regulator